MSEWVSEWVMSDEWNEWVSGWVIMSGWVVSEWVLSEWVMSDRMIVVSMISEWSEYWAYSEINIRVNMSE